MKPSVETLQERFLHTGRISSFAELATLDQENPDLTDIFEAERKRRVLIEGAAVMSDIEGDTDLNRLQDWAQSADPYSYSENPFGRINGV